MILQKLLDGFGGCVAKFSGIGRDDCDHGGDHFVEQQSMLCIQDLIDATPVE